MSQALIRTLLASVIQLLTSVPLRARMWSHHFVVANSHEQLRPTVLALSCPSSSEAVLARRVYDGYTTGTLKYESRKSSYISSSAPVRYLHHVYPCASRLTRSCMHRTSLARAVGSLQLVWIDCESEYDDIQHNPCLPVGIQYQGGSILRDS
jgi:hypothetical protein